MGKPIIFALLAFAGTSIAACDSAETDYCKAGGSLVTAAEGARYCVYEGLSPERGAGLRCPDGLVFKLQIGRIVVCAERTTTVSELPPEVCVTAPIEGCGADADAGASEAGVDAGPSPLDASEDSGPGDSGPGDAGAIDAEPPDLGPTDGGADGGPSPDAGTIVPGCDGHRLCQVAAGRGHACALYATGRVRCWGRGSDGQVGSGGMDATYRTPVDVADLRDAIEITAGWYHTCALRLDGTVACWGINDKGQLGVGDLVRRTRPEAVVGLSGALQVAAGSSHTCARSGESIRCWGQNDSGRLGDGGDVDQPTPVMVVGGLAGSRWVAPGDQHTCAARADGSAVCWGRNSFGTLGDDSGFAGMSLVPVDVLGLDEVAELSSGDATCALRAGAPVTVLCWGNNSHGQVGMPPGGYADTPQQVVLAGTPITVATRDTRVCAVLESGELHCWGGAPRGDGDDMATGTPTVVPRVTNARRIALGVGHACALTESDEVLCWGGNAYGELGSGPTDTDPSGHVTPVSVIGL